MEPPRRWRKARDMESVVMLVVAAVVGATVLGLAVLRVVPAGHRGVVLRAGRPVRSRHPGPMLALPGLERVVMMPTQPPPMDPLSIAATTWDGVEVRLVLSVLWRVTDVRLAAQATPDLRSAAMDAVERSVHHLVAGVDLAVLLREREPLLGRLPATALPLLSSLGGELTDVDILAVEVRVGPELLRLLA